MYMCVCVYLSLYMYMYIHMYIYIYIYIYFNALRAYPATVSTAQYPYCSMRPDVSFSSALVYDSVL